MTDVTDDLAADLRARDAALIGSPPDPEPEPDEAREDRYRKWVAVLEETVPDPERRAAILVGIRNHFHGDRLRAKAQWTMRDIVARNHVEVRTALYQQRIPEVRKARGPEPKDPQERVKWLNRTRASAHKWAGRQIASNNPDERKPLYALLVRQLQERHDCPQPTPVQAALFYQWRRQHATELPKYWPYPDQPPDWKEPHP